MTAETRTPCILVVDDEPYVPRVLELKFTRIGWRTVVARNGLDGLEAIQRERPDVVITDISMPGMNGCELCLEAQRYRRDHPFLLIVVTSRTERDLRAWIRDIPEVLFFEKPVSPKAIAESVGRYVAERSAGGTPSKDEAVATGKGEAA